jgi:predicted acylesterase/phospholipase RssA
MSSFKQKIHFSKTGLVCSGGATKAAAFHMGVALALRDKGFSFVGGRVTEPPPYNSCAYPKYKFHPQEISTFVGSSAGAFAVALLSSGIPIESVLNSFSENPVFKIPSDYKALPKLNYKDMLSIAWPKPSTIIKNLKKVSFFNKTIESMVLKNLRLPGFFSTRGLAQYLKKNVLPATFFNELKADLFIVGTQLDHSRKIIFGRYRTEKTFDTYSKYASSAEIADAVAASMSLPPIFSPYMILNEAKEERYYLDGEIRETLSTHVAKDNGCDLIFCSYTHQPYHYDENIGSLIHYGISAIIIQTLYQSIEQKIYGAKKMHEFKVIALETVREFLKEKKFPANELKELTTNLESMVQERTSDLQIAKEEIEYLTKKMIQKNCHIK